MTPPTSGMTDDEIKALMEKYQACSDRGHPAPCICSSIEQKHWHHFAKELLAARETIEVERMRLAGCGVAALGNTERTVAQRIPRSNLYWSASYGDVCNAVDREMKYREVLEFIANQKDLRGNWAVEKAREVLGINSSAFEGK